MAVLTGTSNNDTIAGTPSDDTIFGLNGQDLLSGEAGNDTVFGGNGEDTLYGDERGSTPVAPGNDALFGGTGSDTLFGQGGNDLLDGAQGEDRLFGGGGDDAMDGGQGQDSIDGGTGADSISGGEGDDRLSGGADNDNIDGGQGQDSIDGGSGADSINGGDGDDRLFGGADDDVIDGGQGQDSIEGGTGADSLSGGTGDDRLFGGDGTDRLAAGPDNDSLYGGFGSDRFTVTAAGNHVIVGGEDPDDSDIDVLDLTGQNVRIIPSETDPEAGRVEFLDENGNVTRRMDYSEIEKVICFTPGTLISTPRGEVRVETLRAGDRIITRDNGIQEIRWSGQKPMTHPMLARAPHLKPVMVRAGALGNGLPERDTLLSPNHRVLVAGDRTQLYFEEPEVLVAAKHLVGMPGIHPVDVIATTYVHFMFDRHEVVLSNGAWTESFQPGDDSLRGIGNAQRTEILELFPELAAKAGLDAYVAARKTLKRHEVRLLK